MPRPLRISLFVLAIAAATTLQAQQPAKSTAADEVLAIVKAQWAAEISDPTGMAAQMKDVADDYTEFNGEFATRIDGKAMNMRLGEASGGASGRTVASEMLNPKVQTYGDVAIVTYNYAGLTKNKDGQVEPNRAKSTRVYVKQNGKWMLVHANFAGDPPPRP
jgi:ketosteroid isomerase-like protein